MEVRGLGWSQLFWRTQPVITLAWRVTKFTPKPRRFIMLILAIDLGKFNSMCCFFDTDSQESRFQLTRTRAEPTTCV